MKGKKREPRVAVQVPWPDYAPLIHEPPEYKPNGYYNPAEQVVTDPQTGGRKGQKLAQFSQIPPDVLWELAEHFGKGMAKYPDTEDGKPNWQRGYSWRLSVDACDRHFKAWQKGEDFDPDEGSSHLIAAIWHLMVLRWFQLHDKGMDYR